jgi:hypothetical protein
MREWFPLVGKPEEEEEAADVIVDEEDKNPPLCEKFITGNCFTFFFNGKKNLNFFFKEAKNNK